jgi:ribosome biogenesis GTPase
MMHDAASPADYPAVGDWVLVDRPSDVDGPVIIHHLLARRSCFARRAAGTSAMLQVVAANVDTIFICMSLNRDFNLRRLERYLAIAWDSGAVPVVVLTKADLADDVPVRVAEVRSVAPGVEVLATSSLDSEGLDSLLHHLRRGTTIAFIGSSGVGKSTLINRLLGQDLLAGHPGPARR